MNNFDQWSRKSSKRKYFYARLSFPLTWRYINDLKIIYDFNLICLLCKSYSFAFWDVHRIEDIILSRPHRAARHFAFNVIILRVLWFSPSVSILMITRREKNVDIINQKCIWITPIATIEISLAMPCGEKRAKLKLV